MSHHLEGKVKRGRLDGIRAITRVNQHFPRELTIRYDNQTFTTDTIDVDGNQYHSCTFNHCKIVFRAADGTKFIDCTVNRCDWVFTKGAEQTIQYLTALYNGQGEGGRDLVEGLFESIRQGGTVHTGSDDQPLLATRS